MVEKNNLPGIIPPPDSVSVGKALDLKDKGFEVIGEDGKPRIIPGSEKKVPLNGEDGKPKIIPFPQKGKK